MKKRIYILMTLLSILCMLVVGMVGCGKTTTPKVTLTVLDTRVTTLETWKTTVADVGFPTFATTSYVQSYVASAVATPPDLTALTNRVTVLETWKTDLEARLTALGTRITALEAGGGGGGGGGGGTTEETTRWTFDSLTVYNSSDDAVTNLELAAGSNPWWTVSPNPSKVEEEDIYEVRLYVYNYTYTLPVAGWTGSASNWVYQWTSAVSLPDVYMEVSIVPKDYIQVNQSTTYLDSDEAPWLDWTNRFVTKVREGVTVCRRIDCTTDEFDLTIPAASITPSWDAVTYPNWSWDGTSSYIKSTDAVKPTATPALAVVSPGGKVFKLVFELHYS